MYKQKIFKYKQFWDLAKPFLINKSDSITIKDKDRFIDDEKELFEIFNNNYINIVEKTSGEPGEKFFKIAMIILKQFSKLFKNTKNIKVF